MAAVWGPYTEQRGGGIARASDELTAACAQNGARLVLHHLGPSTLSDAESLKTDLEGEGTPVALVSGDISLPSTAEAIVSTALSAYGRIDVLVSNAGICPFHAFLDLPLDLWRATGDVNLTGAFLVVQACANAMTRTGGGSIVAISSISALMGGEFQTHYTPTKAGVKSLMESCAIALGKHGIRCNSVLPGTIRTAINEQDLSDETKREAMERRTPLRRLGRPEDIAGPVLFFASDMSSYCTGASLLVDGGAAISLQ